MPGEPSEVRSLTTAAGGTALVPPATRTDYIPIAGAGKLATPGTLTMLGRNFAGGATVLQILLNPRLAVLVSNDRFVASPTDESDDAQDGDATTDVTLSALVALASGGAVYVGAKRPVRGYTVDVDGANAVAATLAGDFWNGSTWATATITDGTAAGGAPFAQDGDITFTVPATWVTGRLVDILSLDQAVFTRSSDPAVYEEMYWMRLSADATLTDPTTLNSIMAINRSTAEAEFLSGQLITVEGVMTGWDGYGCIEAHIDAGTANLIANLEGVFET